MYFCEDLGMEPIMAVWAGRSLIFRLESISNTMQIDEESLPENELAPYIQAAIDQINFVIGDPAINEYGASEL